MSYPRLRSIGAAALTLALAAAAAHADAPDYLAIVRAYADTMIDRGRDTYGPVHSPLFAAALDRKKLTLPAKQPPTLPDIRNGDRCWSGANPMHDLNLYQVLYALGEITAQPRYAAEADAALKWFFENCQSPKGLMGWGEHQGWDFNTESSTAPKAPHEFFRPWVLGDKTASLTPDAMHRFAVGLWEHQIGDQTTGRFSRHAMEIWDLTKKSGRTGYEFPRHGGFYISTWASDYQRTKDPMMLKAIEVLVDSFQKRRHPATGAIPAETANLDLMWPQSNLSLAIDCTDAAPKLPAPLAAKLLACAAGVDETYLKLPHEPGPGGRGFVKSAHTSTLIPGDIRAETGGGETKGNRWKPYTTTWAAGYGVLTTAQMAMICQLRYNQTHDDRYKALILTAAQTYMQSEPSLEPTIDDNGEKVKHPLFPGAVAESIAVELAAYRLTGDTKYLTRADHFGQLAVNIFFTPDSPLPKAGSNHNWYEAITRADTLAMQLLDLSLAKSNTTTQAKLIWTER